MSPTTELYELYKESCYDMAVVLDFITLYKRTS